jgi:hypothetical protein
MVCVNDTQIYEDQQHALPFDAVDRLVNDMDIRLKQRQRTLITAP